MRDRHTETDETDRGRQDRTKQDRQRQTERHDLKDRQDSGGLETLRQIAADRNGNTESVRDREGQRETEGNRELQR